MKRLKFPQSDAEREVLLSSTRALKMAASPHRYVRDPPRNSTLGLTIVRVGSCPKGRRFGFAGIVMLEILHRSQMPWEKSRSKSAISTKP
jgi:hypothetical protein